MKELIENPFCPHCGSVSPNKNFVVCQPCVNKGHWYRLVRDESDRHSTLTGWLIFWSNMHYTNAEIKKIPTYINLTKYTFSKIAEEKSKREDFFDSTEYLEGHPQKKGVK